MRKTILFSAVVLISLVLTGCETLVTNKLPSNAPFGYVEFYEVGPNPGLQVTIYQIFDDKTVNMGNIVTAKRRIACRPGRNRFRVNLGTANEEIEVTIVEQRLTPVMISYVNLNWEGSICRFNMELSQLLPVQYDKK